MNFKDRLKELRQQKKMTQEELGKMVNLGKASISGYENGTREPTNETLIKFSEFFDVSVDYLLGVNQTPKWATKKDTIDLIDFLNNNLKVNMAYDGDDLSDEEIERLKIAMTQVFWDRRKKEK